MSKRTPAILPDDVDPDRLPRHIAIICDGNGRWARERGMPRLLGHHQGYQSVREIVRSASDFGIGALTLYAFSTENWSRPKDETDGLMSLFIEGAKRELLELHANNVKMMFSGDLSTLPAALQAELARHIELTKTNTGLVLNICLNYGARDEILRATKRAAALVVSGEISIDDINADVFSDGLYTAGLPDPDLLVRTAGDMRISNYLLWQIAYAEIVVVDTRWPDFRTPQLVDTLREFQRRDRRYGGVVNVRGAAKS
jgi:undecaprenyl diphosphate synthase